MTPTRTCTFHEQDGDPHLELRRRALAPDAPATTAAAIPHELADVDELADRIAGHVADAGFALLQLDRALDPAELVKLGGRLGPLAPERDPAVQEFTSEGVILNLRTAPTTTTDERYQPFSSDPLRLHTEGSGRPLGHGFKYIVLSCVFAAPGGPRTLLVPFDGVADQLARDALVALEAMSHPATTGTPPRIARREGGRVVFAFRDFGRQFEWAHDGTAVDCDAGNRGLRLLLAAMYTSDRLAVEWSAGMLLVLDNERAFHGRTAHRPSDGQVPRHLQRLRITPAPAAS